MIIKLLKISDKEKKRENSQVVGPGRNRDTLYTDIKTTAYIENNIC